MKPSRISKRIALKKAERTFSSNAVRLSIKEIAITALIVIAIVYVIVPIYWKKMQTIGADEVNFRLADKYRDDYWLYESWVEKAEGEYPVLFLGDSVVWGMYVDNENTLPAIINKNLCGEIVGNIAIDGLHPAAMEGLVDNYCDAIKNKKILLHYNPLWMNSKKYDLSSNSDFQPHHPRLLPQFGNEIKCPRGELADKMAVLRERHIAFYRLLNHTRLAFFDNDNFNHWIVNNFEENFLSKVSLNIDACQRFKDNYTANWIQQGIEKQDWEWVKAEESNQWQAFERIITKLQDRGNEVCVMIGPINPHMMTEQSLTQFRALQQDISVRLTQSKVTHFIAKDLPSECYADASHPLASGYELLAKQIESINFLPLKECTK